MGPIDAQIQDEAFDLGGGGWIIHGHRAGTVPAARGAGAVTYSSATGYERSSWGRVSVALVAAGSIIPGGGLGAAHAIAKVMGDPRTKRPKKKGII